MTERPTDGSDHEITLLDGQDPEPVVVLNPQGRSRFVITCDHAGRRMPKRLGNLGLSRRDLDRHIAWDIGAAETARHLAEALDAPLVLQTYSRLVIDCNRPLSAASAIPEVSDGTAIPGNEDLTPVERSARENAIHTPYHESIAALLDARIAEGPEPVLFAVHSFTPELEVERRPRPWDLGLLYNRDDRLAARFERTLERQAHGYKVAHNEPYAVSDETDYTLPVHGEERGIHNLLLEIRNDHLRESERTQAWGHFLGDLLKAMDRDL